MYASAILATFCLVFLPLSIFAAPAAAPSPLYIVAAGSVTPFDVTGEGVTKDYSFTIHGVNPGNVDIVCQGHGTVRSPELRFAAKLNCPADPNENVFVEFGNDLNVKLSVAWYGEENKKTIDFNYGDSKYWTATNPDVGFNSWTLSTPMEL